jgi:hypothetical protein
LVTTDPKVGGDCLEINGAICRRLSAAAPELAGKKMELIFVGDAL